jgi:restriction endonuclease S subunit
MIRYLQKKPMVALITGGAQADRLDTFFYDPMFYELNTQLEKVAGDIYTADDISEHITDGTHQTPTYTDKDLGVLFISSTNITEQGLDLTDCKYITREEHEQLKSCHPKPGDVLVSVAGSIGTACVYPSDIPESSLLRSVALIRLKEGWIPEFVACFMNSELGQKQILQLTKGVGVKTFRLGEIKEFKFPHISEASQKTILERYSRIEAYSFEVIDKAISVSKNRDELFDSITDSIATEIGLDKFPRPWFGRLYFQKADSVIDRIDVLGANPQFEDKCWKSGGFVPLSEACEVDGSNEQIPLGTQRYISIDSLPGNYWGDIDLPEMEIESQTGRTHFYPGDIAWAHLKPSILQGKAYIIHDECWGSHHFLKLNTSKVSEDLRTIIWAYLKTGPIKRHLANKCTGKSESQKDVSDKALGMLPFPKLDDDQIKRVASAIRDTIERSHELEAQENAYKEKADNLLEKAKSNIFSLLDDDWFNELVFEAKEALQ